MWPVIVNVIGLRCFAIIELEQLQIILTHKCYFSKVPDTCKYNTTSNCITLLKIIEYTDISNNVQTLFSLYI